MTEKFFIEAECHQAYHHGERICGDVFLSGKVKEENRIVLVLSDGMGHGVKANVLASLTASMALNFSKEHRDPEKIAEIIAKTLPECSERKMSYATFTVLDIEYNGKTTILEYNNPETLIIRKNRVFNPGWQCLYSADSRLAGKEIKICEFNAQKDDRIIFCSDGVTQSGLGSKIFPFGWGEESLKNFILKLVATQPEISAMQLATRVVSNAHKNDQFEFKDDTSCVSVYFREPRRLLICTGPPFEEYKDKDLTAEVVGFKGKKIIMGATTADIISRETGVEIEDSQVIEDSELSPESFMQGIDLVTEGILTLSKVERLLQTYTLNGNLHKGPADKVAKLILESDDIEIIIGTRINIAHQDPTLPVELEIRRTVVKRIAQLLENKFLKKVRLKYI